ncbi:kinase-like domain-containing protein [Cunninghamella echinulata]|nr:kinase-like domain-containing protein [Cunninghamella echinulata]
MGIQQSHPEEEVMEKDQLHHKVNINDFETVRVLGKGAFGKVRMVKHIKKQDSYALKIISKGHCIKTNKTKYVLRERNFLEQVDHPLICNLRYAFQDEYCLYMVMDLKLGGDLRYYLHKHGCLSEHLTRFWLSELICAVKYLHLKGIMHRDIKPENILFDLNGHLHLTDFNIATFIPKENHLLTSQCGTLSYFAPEMINGHGYNESIDWWCIGLIFYECIFGKVIKLYIYIYFIITSFLFIYFYIFFRDHGESMKEKIVF